jgi:uncharacterized Zn finger protein (UPF0148 family)
MGKKSRKKREQQGAESSHLPNGVSRCSKCGRPWLTEQMTPHKGDVLCFPCEEEFRMATFRAMDEVAEAERLIQMERAKHAKLN